MEGIEIMPHYKDLHSKVYWLDSVKFEYLLPTDSVQITDEEAESLIRPVLTFDQRVAVNIAAIQAELDRQAQLKSYDNILSACSYAAQPEGAPFQAEGATYLQWRSDVWAQAYAVLAEVQSGNLPLPSPEESVAQMPLLNL